MRPSDLDDNGFAKTILMKEREARLRASLDAPYRNGTGVYRNWVALGGSCGDIWSDGLAVATRVSRWKVALKNEIVGSILHMLLHTIEDDQVVSNVSGPRILGMGIGALTMAFGAIGDVLQEEGNLLSLQERDSTCEAMSLISQAVPKLIALWWGRCRGLARRWIDAGDFTRNCYDWISAFRINCV